LKPLPKIKNAGSINASSKFTFGIFDSSPWLYGAQVNAKNEKKKIIINSSRVDDVLLCPLN
jgi:hypothetical protein